MGRGGGKGRKERNIGNFSPTLLLSSAVGLRRSLIGARRRDKRGKEKRKEREKGKKKKVTLFFKSLIPGRWKPSSLPTEKSRNKMEGRKKEKREESLPNHTLPPLWLAVSYKKPTLAKNQGGRREVRGKGRKRGREKTDNGVEDEWRVARKWSMEWKGEVVSVPGKRDELKPDSGRNLSDISRVLRRTKGKKKTTKERERERWKGEGGGGKGKPNLALTSMTLKEWSVRTARPDGRHGKKKEEKEGGKKKRGRYEYSSKKKRWSAPETSLTLSSRGPPFRAAVEAH